MHMNGFKYNDGGRAAAGYKGSTGDCVCRAIAIATGVPYQEVYDALNLLGSRERPRGKRQRSHSRTGVWRGSYQPYLEHLGWRWVPTMGIGKGCVVHLRANELPPGRLVVRISRHLTCVIDGVINDTFDPREMEWTGENGRMARCVYGYFTKEQP